MKKYVLKTDENGKILFDDIKSIAGEMLRQCFFAQKNF